MRNEVGLYLFVFQDGELLALLFGTIETVIDMIATHHVVVFPYGHNIQTLTRSELYLPIITRHTRDDMITRQRPFLAYMTILNPDIRILRREGYIHQRILNEDRRMRLAVVVHDETLVGHHIL